MEEKQAVFTSLGSMDEIEAVHLLSKSLGDIEDNNLDPGVRLDVIEAIEKQSDEELLAQLVEYRESRSGDRLAEFRETLEGGNRKRG